ncbi:MAG: hypothetical protein WDO16_26295 [Bacteroidota bacterium]
MERRALEKIRKPCVGSRRLAIKKQWLVLRARTLEKITKMESCIANGVNE